MFRTVNIKKTTKVIFTCSDGRGEKLQKSYLPVLMAEKKNYKSLIYVS